MPRPSVPDLLAEAASLALRDVHETTPVRLEFHPLGEQTAGAPGRGIVVVAGRAPGPWPDRLGTLPGWDAAAIEAARQDEDVIAEPVFQTAARVSDDIHELVQVNLAALGQDPTWPACPIHDGRHPLGTDPLIGRWICPHTHSPVGFAWPGMPIGRLRDLATSASVLIRRARREDVPDLVALLADDEIGAGREGADLTAYERAFDRIDADWSHTLIVAESDERIVATLQLTVLPGLARGGATRAQVEAVRVATSARGAGVGATVFRWAIATARLHGCSLIQLTSDSRRSDAHRFYESLGFSPSHLGFKLDL